MALEPFAVYIEDFNVNMYDDHPANVPPCLPDNFLDYSLEEEESSQDIIIEKHLLDYESTESKRHSLHKKPLKSEPCSPTIKILSLDFKGLGRKSVQPNDEKRIANPKDLDSESDMKDQGEYRDSECAEYSVYKMVVEGKIITHIVPVRLMKSSVKSKLIRREKKVKLEKKEFAPMASGLRNIEKKEETKKILKTSSRGPRGRPRRPEQEKPPKVKKRPVKTEFGYQCTVCSSDQVFKFRSGLSRHMRIVHKKKKYVCPACQKEYTRKDSINGHIRAMHEGLSTDLKTAEIQQRESANQIQINFGNQRKRGGRVDSHQRKKEKLPPQEPTNQKKGLLSKSQRKSVEMPSTDQNGKKYNLRVRGEKNVQGNMPLDKGKKQMNKKQ